MLICYIIQFLLSLLLMLDDIMLFCNVIERIRKYCVDMHDDECFEVDGKIVEQSRNDFINFYVG